MAMDETGGTARLRILSDEETDALLRACAGPCERAALGLLVEAGLRPREACGLRVGDVQRDAVRVRGKDGRERPVALGPQLSEALQGCLRGRGASTAAGEPLLLAAGGRPMDVQALGAMLRSVARRAGLSRRLSPHALRATAANRRWRDVKRGRPAPTGGEEA